MTFDDLTKGAILYVHSKHEDHETCDKEIIKNIRKKNNRLEILTDDEYWYVPLECANDCCRKIRQNQLEVNLCSDYFYFRQIYENNN